MIHKPKINIVTDAQALAQTAVNLFSRRVRQVVATKGLFRMAVSGGRTPRRFFELLGRSVVVSDIPWAQCHVFWVDERFVPPTSDASNYKLAKETWLDHVPIPEANVHPVPTDVDNVKEAADCYGYMIRRAFTLDGHGVPKFDFILLGMGNDGHTASLFAGSGLSYHLNDLASAVSATDYPRVTLTPLVIRAASFIVVLISGADKADTLKAVLTEEPHERRWPIHLLWPVLDKVEWLVDREAASRLP